MSRFNFSSIGDVISELFDSDFIDIKRDMNGKLVEVYSNISCHIAYNSTDNPDPNSVDVKPIIQSISIHLPNWVDIRNNDFIVAKKMSGNGTEIIGTYNGRCGNPIVSQARKKVVMNMQGTETQTPTPIPPIIENPSLIQISFNYGETEIENIISEKVEIGKTFTFSPIEIEGYKAIKCFINDIEQESLDIQLEVIENEYRIKYEYEISEEINGFRYLVKGLYTTNDGGLKNGYHLYRKINIDSISKNENEYVITCDDEIITHEDNGLKLSINEGTKLVLVPLNIFVIVDKITSKQNNKITFTATEFTPSEDEKNAYMTGWYDGI